ncbi:MAG TPA: carboxymuconolactone decarboxylase family protein [Pyrinomonadaceae bacterium]|nr:carboxymuconolactone decarboxylase family protein [Pyrinomonadaceae bacterium]
MHTDLPKPVERFEDSYPEVWAAFMELGDRCHNAGTLDEKTRRLVKVALAIGAGLEGGTHSAVRNATAAGVSAAEIRHVAVLSITTLGLPAAMRGITWINDATQPADR